MKIVGRDGIPPFLESKGADTPVRPYLLKS